MEINILNSKDSFESGGQYYVQAAAIIENYSKYSSRVTVNYVDLVKNPTLPLTMKMRISPRTTF